VFEPRDLACQVQRFGLLRDEHVHQVRPVRVLVLADQTLERRPVRRLLEHDPAHRVRPPAIVEEDLGNDRAAEPGFDEPQPEIPVLTAGAHALVVAADRLERGPADERRAVDGVAREQRRKIAALRRPRPALVAEGLEPVRDERHAGIGIEHRDTALEPLRMQPVVGVERAEDVTGGVPRRVVARRRQPVVGGAQDAGRRCLQACQLLHRRRIRGTVVDDDDLDIATRLGGDARERLVDIGAVVVARHQYRNARHDAQPRGAGSSVRSAR
jgi:hypothetical protein